jgi:hypothetical protein
MHIDVTSLAGSVPKPRRLLATTILLDTLARFGDRIVRVRIDVPPVNERGPERHSSLYVLLDDGAMLEASASGPCVTDVMESAAHDMRRRVAIALGVPLCERRRAETSDPRSERRAG